MVWNERSPYRADKRAPRLSPQVEKAPLLVGDDPWQDPDAIDPNALYQEPDPAEWRDPYEDEEFPPLTEQPRRRERPQSAEPTRQRATDPTKRTSAKKKRRRRKEGHPIVYATSIGLCVALLGFIAVFMMPQVAGYFWADMGNYAFVNGQVLRYDLDAVNAFQSSMSYMSQDAIYQGVYIDDIYVGNMTVGQARDALIGESTVLNNTFSITVNVGNLSWSINSSNVPASRNLGNVLDQAYAVGRSNTTETLGTRATPFSQRVKNVVALGTSPVRLTTEVTYDHDAVKAIVDEIAQKVTRDPIDSQIATFDFKQRAFTFTDDQPGVTIDKDQLYADIIAKLDKWEKDAVLTVAPVITTPKVTKAELMSSFAMVAAYTTDTTNSSNRNTNIDLACQAINGTVLMPGETFSFNTKTGERTTAKGYKSAGAIAAGQSIEEVGGGICQVSSTLFNAVARADLEIVSRSPHAWPSTYVNRGEDATVNWPNLDFKFRNNKDTPVFVVMYYNKRKCSAEIYGMSLGVGVTIELESKTTKTTSPPDAAKYVYNGSLAVGESKETIKARTGYKVETYKVWYQGGTEIKRELMHTSNYKPYQRTIEYNDGWGGV